MYLSYSVDLYCKMTNDCHDCVASSDTERVKTYPTASNLPT
jgi:hypothetical protein